uniref:Fungal lipase-like domain-containing protein n=1 Tax=Chenopodium quinoa TaxID=63459 RepID=A0A803N6H0_CHEQI
MWWFSGSGKEGNTEHRRSVAASLVQGVYVAEFDRQQKREGYDVLAPIWWEFFHFKCIQALEDKTDSSIFGAIFEYKHAIPNRLNSTQDIPPRYVIALRGTIIKPKTGLQDCYLDAKIILHELKCSSRYEIALHVVEDLLSVTDPKDVWLTGHSLGAAMTLQAEKDMAKRGCYVETYLFNPPYASAPIEMLHSRKLKNGARITHSVVTAGLSYALKRTKNNTNTTHEECDPFSTTLRSWIPYLFVNPHDTICCEYIGYFEHREKMERWGAGGIEKIATKNSVVNLLKNALGKDGDALHLIPSGFVTMNMKNMIVKEKGLSLAHGLCQWWEQYSCWQSKLYQYN